jgi:hypothetical protein
MSSWFIRCNGETAHNQPGTKRYLPGEPPRYPHREFNYLNDCLRQGLNYLNDCLRQGFARVGWPGAGDLREPGWRTQGKATYGELIQSRHFRYLEEFCQIRVSDIVAIPTYQRQYEVHLGVVVAPRNPSRRRGHSAYYYHYDIQAGDWFDNAHGSTSTGRGSRRERSGRSTFLKSAEPGSAVLGQSEPGLFGWSN